MNRNKLNVRLTLVLLFTATVLLVVLAAGSGEAEGKTITVDGDGEADCTSIREAVDKASEGDTIRVWEGNYSGTVEVNKSLKIIGNGTEKTKLRSIGLYENTGKTVLEDLAFGFDSFFGTVFLDLFANDVVIRNCSIKGSSTGIYSTVGTRNITIIDCLVANCSSTGILADFTDSRIISCTIENCNYGIWGDGDKNIVENCILRNNIWGIAFERGGYQNSINGCSFEGNEIAIYDGGKDTTLNDNHFLNNKKRVERPEEPFLSFEKQYLLFIFMIVLFTAITVGVVLRRSKRENYYKPQLRNSNDTEKEKN